MQETVRTRSPRKRIAIAVSAFLLSYFFFLLIWIQVKDYYGTAVTVTASKILTLVQDVDFLEASRSGDVIEATFTPLSQKQVLIDVPVRTSSYTFNAPLTFALMTALYFYISRKKRAYAEAVAILLALHLLYVFFQESKTLTEVLIAQGIDKESAPKLFVTQFLWGFTDNMAIRFEPFLIGLYMFIRFGR